MEMEMENYCCLVRTGGMGVRCGVTCGFERGI